MEETNGWTDKKENNKLLIEKPKGLYLKSIDVSIISKIAEKDFEMMNNIVEKVGEDNVVQVVTNNVGNYKIVGQMLMAKRRKLFWTYLLHIVLT